jgi:protein-S-isoprenylcysteine O-methyltransferase Ste14
MTFWRPLIAVVAYVALFAALLFIPAGTVHWPAAWILLATLLAVRGASGLLLWRVRRDLLLARTTIPLPKKDQPLADQILLPLFMATFATLPAISAADVWHWHLFASPPLWLRVIGLIAFLAGWWPGHLALRENTFALTVVRYQSERNHEVIETGAYSVVRHPIYAGMLLVMPGLCIWLGSIAGVLASVVPLLLLVIRITVEERVLRSNLPAYKAYSMKVRSRLVPGVW